MRITLSAVVTGSLLSYAFGANAVDVSGARDPLDITRFPYASIDEYRRDDVHVPRDFAVGRIDKSAGELRFQQKVRTNATLESATYRIPDGTPVDEVVAHYRNLLGEGELFSCRGRDCGRSNLWANTLFKVAFLYGPDANQFYLAASWQGQLVGVYVIQRGNKRVYAHVEVMKPDDPVAVGTDQFLTQQLAGRGFVRLDAFHPNRDGSLPDDSETHLQGVAEKLKIFSGQTVYVVCHLYGPGSTATLLSAAKVCSESVVDTLRSALQQGGNTGPDLAAFAAGPLLPREGDATSRIELVLPHRQHRD